jgi:hypothetical protein
MTTVKSKLNYQAYLEGHIFFKKWKMPQLSLVLMVNHHSPKIVVIEVEYENTTQKLLPSPFPYLPVGMEASLGKQPLVHAKPVHCGRIPSGSCPPLSVNTVVF